MARQQKSDLEKFREGLIKTVGESVSAPLGGQPELSIISTGILTVDYALGCGGFPRGHQVMLYGPPSGGKTAFTIHFISELQKRNPEALVAWIDVERSLRADWVEKFGGDPSRIERLLPSTAEESSNFYREAILSGLFDVVVLDSIGGMSASVEIDGKGGKPADAHDEFYGGASSQVSRMVRTGNSATARLERAGKKMPVCILINQQRADIGARYANAVRYSGGWALKHMADIVARVVAKNAASEVLSGTNSTTGQQYKVGSLVSFRIEKNKFAASPRTGEYWFVYDDSCEYEFGVDNIRAVMDIAVMYGLIEQGGSYYTYVDGDEEHRVQGKAAMLDFLREHPQIVADIRDKVISHVYSEAKQGADAEMQNARIVEDE